MPPHESEIIPIVRRAGEGYHSFTIYVVSDNGKYEIGLNSAPKTLDEAIKALSDILPQYARDGKKVQFVIREKMDIIHLVTDVCR